MHTKNQNISTPIGVAIWPKLNEPDTRFKEEGEYQVNLRLPKTEAEPLLKVIKDAQKAEYQRQLKETGKPKLKLADLPVIEVDGGEEFIDLKFKAPASGTTKAGKKWEKRIMLFDSKGKPLGDDSPRIGGGSRIRVNAEVRPYFVPAYGVGVSLRINAVQVIELHEGGMSSKAASAYGFTAEESGFVAGGEDFPFDEDKEQSKEVKSKAVSATDGDF